MILVAGLSPAWQQIYTVEPLRLGEVNRSHDSGRCAAGKVLNVGVALGLLGIETRVLSVVDRKSRDEIDSEIGKCGATCRWVEIGAPLRTCTTIIDCKTNVVTELVESAGPILPDELVEFRRAFAEEAEQAEFVILSGSIPSETPCSIFAELLADVRCPVLLDIRGPELRLALERKPLIVKLNREELAMSVQRSISDAKLPDAMGEVNDLGAQWVVVTEGKKADWIQGDGRLYRAEPPAADQGRILFRGEPPVLDHVVNPIGCGDAMSAGIAAAITRGDGLLEAVGFWDCYSRRKRAQSATLALRSGSADQRSFGDGAAVQDRLHIAAVPQALTPALFQNV